MLYICHMRLKANQGINLPEFLLAILLMFAAPTAYFLLVMNTSEKPHGAPRNLIAQRELKYIYEKYSKDQQGNPRNAVEIERAMVKNDELTFLITRDLIKDRTGTTLYKTTPSRFWAEARSVGGKNIVGLKVENGKKYFYTQSLTDYKSTYQKPNVSPAKIAKEKLAKVQGITGDSDRFAFANLKQAQNNDATSKELNDLGLKLGEKPGKNVVSIKSSGKNFRAETISSDGYLVRMTSTGFSNSRFTVLKDKTIKESCAYAKRFPVDC